VARRGKEFADVLEKYVCVRVPQVNSLDLATFQFDYGLTWSVFFMNADRTLYGRYGTRSALSRPGDVTDAGFRKAALAALELHRGYPGNKDSLRGKTGPLPAAKVPRDFPTLATYPATVDPRAGEWNNATCIHCHDVHSAQIAVQRAARKPIPMELLWPYPMPDALGLTLDPEERASVGRVAPGSAAEKAGFKAGDELLRLEGQPLVSIADVQWVLQNARDGASLTAVVKRGAREESLTLVLPAGWRRSGDTSWRMATSVFFRPDLQAGPLSAEDRQNLGLDAKAIALRISRLGTPLENAGFRAGDVIVAVGERRSGIDSLSQILEHVGRNTSPGEKLPIVVLRDGKELRLEILLP
jgi:hypothetical protein